MQFSRRDCCWLTLVVACLGGLWVSERQRGMRQHQLNATEAARSKYRSTLFEVGREWAAETNREVKIEMPEGRPLYAYPDGKLSHQPEPLR